VIVTFAVIAVVFLPVGIVLLVTSEKIQEVTVQYDNDPSCTVNTTTSSNSVCSIPVTLPSMTLPVYIYYKLDNFYQNHRRYVGSRNDDQLGGSVITSYSSLSSCDPIESFNGSTDDPSLFYTPCGLIAWSTFNDTFQLDGSNGSLAITDSGIAWPSDVGKKFQNPPPNSPGYPTLDATLFPDFIEDERFIVWMRVAGLPSFRKLWGIINQDIPAGNYNLSITNRFPVSSFSGSKYFVISEGSWAGGKNNFLGIAYIVVGSLCAALAVTLFLLHRMHPRQLGDPNYLKWRT